MRRSHSHNECRLDRTPIEQLSLDYECRDEIVCILAGLRNLYLDEGARGRVLNFVARDINKDSDAEKGRRGMDLWQIAVLAGVRLGLDADYDKLQDLATNHCALRIVLGLGEWQGRCFDWRQIQDNITALSPETLSSINTEIVNVGHRLQPGTTVNLRVDSTVTQTNIHHPQDVVQVGDGIRVILRWGARLGAKIGSTLFRQHGYLEKERKRIWLGYHRARKSRGRNREERLKAAAREALDFSSPRIDLAERLLIQARLVAEQKVGLDRTQLEREIARLSEMVKVTQKAEGVARRFALEGEQVPVGEKVFSVFEPETELIHRGKTPIPYEFGHRVLVVEDGLGFLVHAEVMGKGETDRDVCSRITKQMQERFAGEVLSISFDRGFHSPENQEALADLVPTGCLPTTGCHAAAEQDAKASEAWHKARKRHAGIESAIGALQSGNGFARCRDRGVVGYARYVQLSALGRNLHTLGRLVVAKEAPKSEAARSKRKVA